MSVQTNFRVVDSYVQLNSESPHLNKLLNWGSWKGIMDELLIAFLTCFLYGWSSVWDMSKKRIFEYYDCVLILTVALSVLHNGTFFRNNIPFILSHCIASVPLCRHLNDTISIISIWNQAEHPWKVMQNLSGHWCNPMTLMLKNYVYVYFIEIIGCWICLT